MDALLRPDTARALAAANDDRPDRRRLKARLGYGFALFGGGWTGVPEVGFGLTEASREYIHAWRLLEARDAGLLLGLDVEGVRNEKLEGDAGPEHRVGLGLGWELVGARRENLELRLEASRRLPANDNPENRIGVRAHRAMVNVRQDPAMDSRSVVRREERRKKLPSPRALRRAS